MGTFIAGVAVAAVLFLAVRSMIRRKKQGGSLTCGNCKDCKNCGGRCPFSSDIVSGQ